MIKGPGSYKGKPMLVIGLSGENMARLMAREPIMLNAGELGLPEIYVFIVGGPTEGAIADDLRQFMDNPS